MKEREEKNEKKKEGRRKKAHSLALAAVFCHPLSAFAPCTS
jgi:hypothetical protein